jgi:CheY-like chemotaxis protein
MLCYNHIQMSNQPQPPLIVGFVTDLMFTVKIESVVERLNYTVRWIERANQLAPGELEPPDHNPAEHLSGAGMALVDQLTRWHPALILIDLSNQSVPWREWLPMLKTVPATRRIPVICFGSHVDVETMKFARSCGAEAVLARSRFASDMPNLILRYARVPDYEGLQATCKLSLSALALKGLEEFNQGEYFEAHESLEAAWNEDQTPGRDLYRAILQVAVAYLQIERSNFNGAVKMFFRMRQWIDPLPGICRGVDIARLRTDAEQVRMALMAGGPENIHAFDRSLFKPVIYEVKDDIDHAGV